MLKITPLLSNGPGIQRGALQSILPSYYYTSPPGARRAVPGTRRIASSLPSGPGDGKERPNSGSDQPVYFLSPQDSVRAKILPFLTDILWHPWDFSCSSECTSLRIQEFSAPWEEGLTPMVLRYRMMMVAWRDDESNACRKPLLTFAKKMNGIVEYCIPGFGDFWFLVTLRTVMQLPVFYTARKIYKPSPAIITVIL